MKRLFAFILLLALACPALASTTPYTATKTVTTAGTRVTLVAANTFTASVVIQAKCANTGYIYLGDATVSSTNGIRLAACEKIGLTFDPVQGTNNPIDLLKWYIDSSVNSEGVNLLYTSWK